MSVAPPSIKRDADRMLSGEISPQKLMASQLEGAVLQKSELDAFGTLYAPKIKAEKLIAKGPEHQEKLDGIYLKYKSAVKAVQSSMQTRYDLGQTAIAEILAIPPLQDSAILQHARHQLNQDPVEVDILLAVAKITARLRAASDPAIAAEYRWQKEMRRLAPQIEELLAKKTTPEQEPPLSKEGT